MRERRHDLGCHGLHLAREIVFRGSNLKLAFRARVFGFALSSGKGLPSGRGVLANQEQFLNALLGFMELRFRIADRTIEQASNFLVFVAFHLVKQEDSPVADREFANRTRQGDAVDGACKLLVANSIVAADRAAIFLPARLVERDLPQRLLTKMHEDGVDGHAIEPG